MDDQLKKIYEYGENFAGFKGAVRATSEASHFFIMHRMSFPTMEGETQMFDPKHVYVVWLNMDNIPDDPNPDTSTMVLDVEGAIGLMKYLDKFINGELDE